MEKLLSPVTESKHQEASQKSKTLFKLDIKSPLTRSSHQRCFIKKSYSSQASTSVRGSS